MRRLGLFLLLGGCFFEPAKPDAGPMPPPPSGTAHLAAGSTFACAIQSGTLKCWGHDDSGEAGVLPPTHFVEMPTAIPGTWSAIAAGGAFACGIRDSSLVCWGTYGNIVQGGPSLVTLPGNATPVKVFAGASAVCALDAAGTAYCLGGIGADSYDVPTPLVVGGSMGPWKSVSLGYHHQCVIDATDHLYCWGGNSQGQLGTGDTVDRARDQAESVPGYTFSAVAAGSSGTCAITTDHQLVCFGAGMYRQDIDGPPKLVDNHTWTAISSTGFSFVCGVRDGDAWCYGVNAHGALGDGFAPHIAFHAAATTGATEIAAGEEFACALGSDIRCWGSNQWGEMGNGKVATTFTPTKVMGLPAPVQLFAQISSAGGHTCVLDDAVPYCWGENLLHQSTPSADLPAVLPTLALQTQTQLNQLAVSDSHNCGITTSGTHLQCWGDPGAIGGSGPTSDTLAPTSETWITVGANDATSCGASSGTKVECDGLLPWTGTTPVSGTQVTVGSAIVATTASSSTDTFVHYSATSVCDRTPTGPEMVEMSGSVVKYVTASGDAGAVGNSSATVCALDENKALYCFGPNGSNQISADGTVSCYDPKDATHPFARIAGSWDAVTLAGRHMCGLQGTSLLCWGQNEAGELGDIAQIAQTPVQVAAGTQWKEVSLGIHHICAIPSVPTEVDCWGLNIYGETGAGERFHDVPTAVQF